MENQQRNVHKLRTVRQERRSNYSGKLFLNYDNNIIEVRDYTSFSLSVFFEFDNIKEIHGQLFVSKTQIAEVTLEFVRKGIDDLGNVFSAFKILSTPIDLTQVEAALRTHEMLLEHSSQVKVLRKDLPEQFVITTYQLKDWLGELEAGVQGLALNSFDISSRSLTEYENTVCQIVAHHLSTELPNWFQKMANSIHGCEKQIVSDAFNFFRSQVGPFLYQSYYSHRAYNKPLGYAGDYEMMNTVYSNEKRGNSLFARCIHHYFTDVPEAKAVRNRADFLYEKIEMTLKKNERPVKILAVASGPAKELQDLFTKQPELMREGTEFHLLDQDESALQYSQKMLQSLIAKNNIKAQIYLHRRQIKEVISQGIDVGEFDLIYSAGLFDYLSDPVATFAATTLHKSLAAKGELIIGNFNVGIPNEFGMSLIMDWKLIYRSKEELIRLFEPASKNIRVEEEPEGINLFAIIDKDAA